MGKSVQRVGDTNSAGGVAITPISTVRANGRPLVPVGSVVTPHPCCGRPGCNGHCNATTTGSSTTVRAEGKTLVLTGDVDTCGHPRVGGSPNVRIG